MINWLAICMDADYVVTQCSSHPQPAHNHWVINYVTLVNVFPSHYLMCDNLQKIAGKVVCVQLTVHN